MAIKLDQIWTVSEGDTDMGAIDCSRYLDSGELVSSVTSVTEQTTSDLTIDNIAVSTAALTIFGETVAIGEAIQFRFSGQLEINSPYTLRCTFVTDSSPARTKVIDQVVEVIA